MGSFLYFSLHAPVSRVLRPKVEGTGRGRHFCLFVGPIVLLFLFVLCVTVLVVVVCVCLCLYSRSFCFFLVSLVQAKQRASVQWLLSKAYGHQVPEDVKEPFYRDLEVCRQLFFRVVVVVFDVVAVV